MFEERIDTLNPKLLANLILNRRCPLCINTLNEAWICTNCLYEADWLVYPCCFAEGIR
jgi:hypothetical protein